MYASVCLFGGMFVCCHCSLCACVCGLLRGRLGGLKFMLLNRSDLRGSVLVFRASRTSNRHGRNAGDGLMSVTGAHLPRYLDASENIFWTCV